MGCVSYVWTFDQIRQHLLPHRHTLQELRIGLIGPLQTGLDRFGMHAFENLRTLQLCNIGMPSPEKACDLWLTPSLQRFVLEYSRMELQCGILWCFEEDHISWLAAFSQIAADRRKKGVSGLHAIEVISDTGINYKHPMSDSARRQIEANCAKAKVIVESFGIKFVWCREMQ